MLVVSFSRIVSCPLLFWNGFVDSQADCAQKHAESQRCSPRLIVVLVSSFWTSETTSVFGRFLENKIKSSLQKENYCRPSLGKRKKHFTISVTRFQTLHSCFNLFRLPKVFIMFLACAGPRSDEVGDLGRSKCMNSVFEV